MRVYLIGFMGSGKSTAGRKLARKLQLDFYDLDDLIEQERGMSISDYFEKYGEENFRLLERKILRQTFEKNKVLISTGGGTPCFFDNIEAINRNGVSVYLDADIPLIVSRLKNEKAKRPLIKNKREDELHDALSELLNKREKFYRQAQIIVPAKDLNINKLAEKIKLFAKE